MGDRRWLAAILVFGTATAQADLAGEIARFDIATGAARGALQTFVDQSGWQVVYDSRDVAGLKVAALRGEMSVRSAMEHLLRGSRLTAEFEEFSRMLYICPRPDMLPRQRDMLFRDAPLRPQDTPRGGLISRRP